MSDEERRAFMETRQPVLAVIDGQDIALIQRMFASGSVGWHGNAKLTIHGSRVQCNLILTVVGSKPEGHDEQKDTGPQTAPKAPQTASKPKKGKTVA